MRLNFQDPATIVMENIIDFYNLVQFYIIIIVIFVAWMLFSIIYLFGFKYYIKKDLIFINSALEARKNILFTKSILHGTVLEVVWTILPVMVLIVIAIPSFALLYSIDEVIEPSLDIKVIGNQWYWSYEYSSFKNSDLVFDSYMKSEDELKFGQLRLLEVDKQVWLPVNTHIRFLVTATDVLHSWSIPSCGIKMDAIPGRLNQVSLFLNREGIFYGQCSELCGVQHGFMPISLKSVNMDFFVKWTENKIEAKELKQNIMTAADIQKIKILIALDPESIIASEKVLGRFFLDALKKMIYLHQNEMKAGNPKGLLDQLNRFVEVEERFRMEKDPALMYELSIRNSFTNVCHNFCRKHFEEELDECLLIIKEILEENKEGVKEMFTQVREQQKNDTK